MAKIFTFMKTIWFWLWNWPLLPNNKEKEIIESLANENIDETRNWLYISVLLNLFPFIFSLLIELVVNRGNWLCLLNNGSLPILAYSLLATNFFYLLENVPAVKESTSFHNVKTRLYVLAVLTMFISAVLYIFQSNFSNEFQHGHLVYSLIISVTMLVMSIVWGSKMYLLQQEKIETYSDNLAKQSRNLSQPDGEYQQ
jgi:hypothetical protein